MNIQLAEVSYVKLTFVIRNCNNILENYIF